MGRQILFPLLFYCFLALAVAQKVTDLAESSAHHTQKRATTPTLTLTSSGGTTVEAGTQFQLDVTIDPPDATGTITFSFDNPTGAPTECGTTGSLSVDVGAPSCSVYFSDVNTFGVTATYSGDANYASTTATLSIQVTQFTPVITVTFNPPSPDANTNTEVIATVTHPTNAAMVVSAGSVTFTFSGPASVASQTIAVDQSGVATFPARKYAAGSWSVTAAYGGSTLVNSNSQTQPFTVKQYGATINFNVLPSSGVANSVIDFTVSVSTAPSSSTTPTGTVTFSWNPQLGAPKQCGSTGSLTVTLSGGSATCSAIFSVGDTFTPTVSYSGASNIAATTTSAQSSTVIGYRTVLSFGASPTSGSTGVPLTLTATVLTNPSSSIVPSGDVVFSFSPLAGAPTVCQGLTGLVVTPVNGVASCTVTFNTAGIWTPKANYTGDSLSQPSTGIEILTITGQNVTTPAATTPASLGTTPTPNTTNPTSSLPGTTVPGTTATTLPGTTTVPGSTATTQPGFTPVPPVTTATNGTAAAGTKGLKTTTIIVIVIISIVLALVLAAVIGVIVLRATSGSSSAAGSRKSWKVELQQPLNPEA